MPDLAAFYPPSYYGAKTDRSDIEGELVREAYKVDLVQDFARSGRILEVGPARGAFAYLMKEAGFEVSVIERDVDCSRYLNDVLGVRAVNSSDAARALADEEPHDVIALWQVIEHLEEPWKFMRVAAERLRPNGILVIATPNPESLQFRLLGRFWTHLDAPRHLQIIPARVLKEFAARLGLEMIFLTASDGGVEAHNIYGWQNALPNHISRAPLREFARRKMGSWARAIAPFERSGFRSSSYTIVLRKASA